MTIALTGTGTTATTAPARNQAPAILTLTPGPGFIGGFQYGTTPDRYGRCDLTLIGQPFLLRP